MSRNVSILSVVAAMVVVTVLSVATVAFAEQEDGGGLGHPKVTLCHNGHTITVGAEAAHLDHGDTLRACADLRHEHNGYDGNHHEPYRYERDHGHYGNTSYRVHGYDNHTSDLHCRYDNGNDGYHRHYHGHLRQAPLALLARAPRVRQQGRPVSAIG